MKFNYVARTKTGELQTGTVEGINKEGAFAVLKSHDLFLLSLEEPQEKRWYSSFLDYFRRIKQVDLAVFTRQFSTVLQAGIPLGDALKNLYRQTRNATLKEMIFEMNADIDSGLSLSQTLARHSNVFSEFYINLVRSAEVTGRIEEVMGFLADYLEKEHIIRSKVRNALIYPTIVIALFFAVGAILIGVVFPQIGPIFEESGVTLPLVTRILLGTGTFLSEWWLAVIVVIIILIIILIDYSRSKEGRLVFDELSVKLPIVGQLFRKMYVSRFAEATNVLMRGSIPVTQAIEIASHTVGNVVYREILHDAADAIRRGELLSKVLEAQEEYFPPIVSQMVGIGEATGKLDEMFVRIAAFYSREVDDMVGNLVELIQPALMIVVGVMTGLLFASILLPIYNLVQRF